jgi:putative transcriptional regulator
MHLPTASRSTYQTLDDSKPMAYILRMKETPPITISLNGRNERMNGQRILESMEEAVAIARGDLPRESYSVHIPEHVDVKAIRSRLGLSQMSFAARFGLSLYAIRNWEQGKRQPELAARAYLKVIEKAPETVADVLALD